MRTNRQKRSPPESQPDQQEERIKAIITAVGELPKDVAKSILLYCWLAFFVELPWGGRRGLKLQRNVLDAFADANAQLMRFPPRVREAAVELLAGEYLGEWKR